MAQAKRSRAQVALEANKFAAGANSERWPLAKIRPAPGQGWRAGGQAVSEFSRREVRSAGNGRVDSSAVLFAAYQSAGWRGEVIVDFYSLAFGLRRTLEPETLPREAFPAPNRVICLVGGRDNLCP